MAEKVKSAYEEAMEQKEFPTEGPSEEEIKRLMTEEPEFKKRGPKAKKAEEKLPPTIDTHLKREATAELTKKFRHLLGSASEVVFFKIDPDYGKRGFIVTVDTQDLGKYSHLKEYVDAFLVPKHGKGQYIAQFRIKQTDGSMGVHEETIDTGIEEKRTTAEAQLEEMRTIHNEIRKIEAERAEVMKSHFNEQIRSMEEKIKNYQKEGYSEAALSPLREEISRLRDQQLNADRNLQWANLLIPALTPFFQSMMNRGNSQKEIMDTSINLLGVLEGRRQDSEKIIGAIEKIGQNKSLVDQIVENMATNPDNIKKAVDFMTEARKTVGDRMIDSILGNQVLTAAIVERFLGHKKEPNNPANKLTDWVTSNPEKAMAFIGKVTGMDDLKAEMVKIRETEMERLKSESQRDKIGETVQTIQGFKQIMDIMMPAPSHGEKREETSPIKQMKDAMRDLKDLGDFLKPYWGVSASKWDFITRALEKGFETLAPMFTKIAEGYAHAQASKFVEAQAKFRSLPIKREVRPETPSERPEETKEAKEGEVVKEEVPKEEITPKNCEEVVTESFMSLAKAGVTIDKDNFTTSLTSQLRKSLENGKLSYKTEELPSELEKSIGKVIPDFSPIAIEIATTTLKNLAEGK